MSVLLTDEGGTFESRIEALDSARVEDMVREYFAEADEVGLLAYYSFCTVIISIKFNVRSYKTQLLLSCGMACPKRMVLVRSG